VIRRLLLAALLLLGGSPVAAHKLSDAYLRLDLSPAGVAGSIDIALRDLEAVIGFDSDGDGAVTWGELRQAHPAIAAYVASRLAFGSADAPCELRPTEHLVDTHTDGAYAVLRFEVACPRDAEPRLMRYAILFDIDPMHRGIVAMSAGGSTTTAVLSPERPELVLGAAPAHGGGFDAFFLLGMEHITFGFDHLLFLLVVLLPAVYRRDPENGRRPVAGWIPALLEIAKILTAFTLAHGTSLALAMTGLVVLPSRLVESAIAATIVCTAIDNVRPWLPGRRWQVAFFFGLIHGLGFAAALGPLDLPPLDLAMALLGFNLGIEAVQLLIAALFLAAAFPLRRRRLYDRGVLPAGSLAALALAGVWLVDRAFDMELMPF
jgi:hypothetical protein